MIRTLAGLLLVLVAACDCPGGVPLLPGDDGGTDGGAVGPACAVDDDCALGERCVDEVCTAVQPDIVDEGCRDDGDCQAGELCALATGRCVVDAPAPGVPTGPPGSCNDSDQRTCGQKIGACDYGVELCAGGAWSGVCTGAIGPVDERCDGVDDDCDGAADEDFTDVGDACTDGLGACEVTGFKVCSPDGTATVCTAQGLDPTGRVEHCGDGVDEDCDGAIDQGFESLGQTCFIGDPSDPCRTEGAWACAPGNLALNCEVVLTAELCNGVDDDNDNCIDEGFPVGDPCQDGVGECVRTGQLACAPGGADVVCEVVTGTPALVEDCDNDDDDCNAVDDNGCDDDEDGYCDATLAFSGSLACPLSTSASVRDCNDDNGAVRPGATEICNNAVDEDCDGQLNNGCVACNLAIDADFDGEDQCEDCDDNNGGVFHAAVERCNGIDENCNDAWDETFDKDGDGYTTCGTGVSGGLNPARIDCNDTPGVLGASINPGACEVCLNGTAPVCGTLPNNAGNNVDEDCDGYVDELCKPCEDADPDNDGFSECEGDCLVNDPTVYPGRPEACDGKDTDCNIRTVENCEVGDPCNFTAVSGVVPDVCAEDLICVEALGGGGNPTGDFSCTSFCNETPGGLLGDSCDLDETCRSGLTPSENLHGCGLTTDFGATATGVTCTTDAQCRSGRCQKDIRFGNGGNAQTYCIDYCGSDAYCPTGTRCMVDPFVSNPPLASFATSGDCFRPTSSQTVQPGAACPTAGNCIHGAYACFDEANPTSGTNRTCHEPCCKNSDCDGDERCGFVGRELASQNFGVDSVPFCTAVSGGNGGRPSGAACSDSDQCAGEFCDVILGVCVDVCCNDAACPTGTTCEIALTTLPSGQPTFARMCLASTPADPLEAR